MYTFSENFNLLQDLNLLKHLKPIAQIKHLGKYSPSVTSDAQSMQVSKAGNSKNFDMTISVHLLRKL